MDDRGTTVEHASREFHPLTCLPIPTSVLHELDMGTRTGLVRVSIEIYAGTLQAKLEGAQRALELLAKED
jgi:hypothetical protein